MKIYNALAITGLACLAVTSADRTFKPPKPEGSGSGAGRKHIKTAVNFGKGGAKIDLCPSGDCENGQLVTLAMARLEEFKPDGTQASNKAENFNKVDTEWTELEEVELDGVPAMSTSFVAPVAVGPSGNSGTAQFNLTATIVSGNATAMNGNQAVPVPAGALKFTVQIKDWPFKSSANHLRFGVSLRARGKDGQARPKPEKKPKKSANGTEVDKIDRVDMGEGMFMDAPALAVIDGAEADINATVQSVGNTVEYVWEFPYFNETLFYDPVVGSEDPSAQPTDGTEEVGGGGATPAPTPAPTTKAPSSAQSWKLVSGLAAGVAAMAVALF